MHGFTILLQWKSGCFPPVEIAVQVDAGSGFMQRLYFVEYVDDPSVVGRVGNIEGYDVYRLVHKLDFVVEDKTFVNALHALMIKNL